jgi:hypothetical protein
VPYRGDAPAVTDLLGGQVQMMFAAVPGASNEYILTGKLRALAVTTATRWMALPNVPTLGEFVPGFEASGWFGFGAPKNTSVQIIDKLNREINAVLADPKIIARLPARDCSFPAMPLCCDLDRRADCCSLCGDGPFRLEARFTELPPAIRSRHWTRPFPSTENVVVLTAACNGEVHEFHTT